MSKLPDHIYEIVRRRRETIAETAILRCPCGCGACRNVWENKFKFVCPQCGNKIKLIGYTTE